MLADVAQGLGGPVEVHDAGLPAYPVDFRGREPEIVIGKIERGDDVPDVVERRAIIAQYGVEGVLAGSKSGAWLAWMRAISRPNALVLRHRARSMNITPELK